MSTAADFRAWLAGLRATHPEHAAQLAEGLVYLGVSGGADSLALAYTAAGIAKKDLPGASFRALVVDHQLQEGSAEVAATAARICEEMGIPAQVLTIDVPGGPGADEAAAREARYRALGAAAAGRPLLVAHTASDDAEGLLLGLARGSGAGALAGLRPITTPAGYLTVANDPYPPANPAQGNEEAASASHAAATHQRPDSQQSAGDQHLASNEHPAIAVGAAWLGRPLLASTREDTEATCRRAGLSFWSDPHNSSPRFRRSRVRQELLPLLEDILGPGVADSLSRTARLLREDADYLDAAAHAEYASLTAQATELEHAGGHAHADNCERAQGRTQTEEHEQAKGHAHAEDHVPAAELPCAPLAELPTALRRRVIRHWLAGKTGPLTYSHLSRIDALVTDWAGQGGVSVPWHTMNGYEALGRGHAHPPSPPPAGAPPTGQRRTRLVVARRGGVLRLVAEESHKHPKDRRAHD
ncbi:tRNA lysidine(34) synthetase TilS [Corynebacterium sp. MSK039]|uniref:tRNA lysidine(34) synthetase TilS n=1 Tax=Corynebacterium sp. MSK039 TaxID=3050193 RepID=UPI00254A2DD5|nr:tRNA lysidine(34) synthetase TilS [Corynebacterium sp. MSK039]MDK8790846.1 tRNA lysidine(34) synthetase TilS [Corynebacterium sp. MSK039]